MSKRKSPAFSFYADSWIGGTLRMSFEEKGIYMELLADQWCNGGFSRDVAMRVCRGADEAVVMRILDDKFMLGKDGLYVNTRLETERQKQLERSEKARKSGLKGGRPKSEKKATAKADEKLQVKLDESCDESCEKAEKKLSVSVSDSVLVLDSDSLSQKGESERKKDPEQPDPTPEGNTAGDQFRFPSERMQAAWDSWRRVVALERPSGINEVAMEQILIKLGGYGERRATAFLLAWIEKGRYQPLWTLDLEPYLPEATAPQVQARVHAPRLAGAKA